MKPSQPDDPQDSNEDIDTLEQQLRSIRPTPPTRSWNSIADSIDGSLDQSAVVSRVSPTASAWRPVVSHSLTAAVGMAVGVATMLILPLRSGPPSEGSAPVEIAGHQNSEDAQRSTGGSGNVNSLTTSSETFGARNRRSAPAWRSYRFIGTTLRSEPLRAFGSVSESARLMQTGMEFNSHPPSRQPDGDSDDGLIEPSDDFPIDNPVLSPRSLHLFLDELTCLPTSDNPFCKAEGSRS